MSGLSPERREELEREILSRLEAKSAHEYQWPRWAAAYEAAEAIAPLVAGWIANGGES